METKKRKKIKSDNKPEKEVIPSEKWLVSFKNNNNTKGVIPRLIIRQFYAEGYYEAYDIIRTLYLKSSLF